MNPLTDLDVRLVIGHRGNAAFAPENTLESFDQAVALGVDAIEFDVRLARDGVRWLCMIRLSSVPRAGGNQSHR